MHTEVGIHIIAHFVFLVYVGICEARYIGGSSLAFGKVPLDGCTGGASQTVDRLMCNANQCL